MGSNEDGRNGRRVRYGEWNKGFEIVGWGVRRGNGKITKEDYRNWGMARGN